MTLRGAALALAAIWTVAALSPAHARSPWLGRRRPPPAAKKSERKQKPARSKRWSKRYRGRIDFDKAPLAEVTRFIADITGKNIILGSNSRSGKITIFAPRKVSRWEAFRIFRAALSQNDLTLVRLGRFYRVVPAREAKTQPGPIFDLR